MLKVFTSFSGYDSQCLALNRLGLEYDLVGWSEIDKYAIQAHNALFPQYAERNYGDISKIDWANVPNFDLFTYSSPCQDFSIAGLQRGGEKGSNTRSSLLWECEKAISIKRPKYCLMENVSALVSAKFVGLFNSWQRTLEKLGYKNFAKVLNAKNYGVPQNRERIFLVSILDDSAQFEFPKEIPLTKKLKDMLETGNVPEKYYISDAMITYFKTNTIKQEKKKNGFRFSPSDGECIAKTINTRAGGRMDDNFIIQVGEMKGGAWDSRLRCNKAVFSPEGIAPTQTTCGGGGVQTKIIEKNEL